MFVSINALEVIRFSSFGKTESWYVGGSKDGDGERLHSVRGKISASDYEQILGDESCGSRKQKIQ